jgi:uncharacterized integral membrane protein (TIGR00697 family)
MQMVKSSTAPLRKNYKYYDFIMAAFATILICSNIIGAGKVCEVDLGSLGKHSFGAGVFFFPLSYVFGDILTEVYGYARARRIVWMGFASLLFASFMAWFIVKIPPAPGWSANQPAYEIVFGAAPRIVAASLIAYCCGEFINSFTLAKMKVFTAGKHLWMRMIGSTVFGEGVDTLLFYPLAFYGIWSNELLLGVMLSNYVLKVSWEVVLTPITYKIVNFLKRVENEDYYDRDTNFTPFSIST